MHRLGWWVSVAALAVAVVTLSGTPDQSSLLGNRFLTLATVVRVRQIEMTRNDADGPDESSVHTPAEARLFRETIARAWPGARITWAFSWLALNDQRRDYKELRELVVSYHQRHGDELTFIPGGYFANDVQQPRAGQSRSARRPAAGVGDGGRRLSSPAR